MNNPSKFCKDCGTALEESAKFCEACGHPVEEPSVNAVENFQTPAPQAYNIDDPGQAKPPIKKGKSVRLWVAAFAVIVLLVVGAVVLIPMLNPTTLTLSNGIEFVKIPAGEFDMGSPASEIDRSDFEGPVHRVKISKAFYMGKYEITQKQWRDVMGTNPSYFKGDNLPVENVSWNDAQEFIKKLNEKEGLNKYRLPSEAEWEYAARAGTTSRYSFGDDESKLGDYAWYAENSGLRPPKKGDYFGYDEDDWINNKWNGITHDVGQNKPNPWGLYDMYGNVREWVQDTYHDNYTGAPVDGSAWESESGYSNIVSRGGSWFINARACRSASRAPIAWPSNDGGFRLVRDL